MATALSKSELAYQVLRERILNGEYGSGYRLVLSQLADEFAISAVPVREAIRRLEAEGLVTFIRNVGAQVNGVDLAEYETTMQTLALVEGAATAWAAPHLTKADLAEARAINRRMSDMIEEFRPNAFNELNVSFHQLICAKCPNDHVQELVTRGYERMRMVRRADVTFVPARAKESVVEHDNILDLIETQAAPIDIELAARTHKLHTLENVIHRIDEEDRKKVIA